jgi:hypothetical protein
VSNTIIKAHCTYRDAYVREGLVAIMKVKFLHSHRINVSEAWRWLKRHPEVNETFIGYFNNGLFSNIQA